MNRKIDLWQAIFQCNERCPFIVFTGDAFGRFSLLDGLAGLKYAPRFACESRMIIMLTSDDQARAQQTRGYRG